MVLKCQQSSSKKLPDHTAENCTRLSCEWYDDIKTGGNEHITTANGKLHDSRSKTATVVIWR